MSAPLSTILPQTAVRGARQATLAAAFERAGPGLHTGRRAHVRVSPAAPGAGILFRRRLKGGQIAEVPALWRHRESQPLCTALRSRDGVLVRTVEHLMAALSAHRIDNALVEIDAEELPIFDGSALPWCAGIRGAGRVEQDAPSRWLRVLRPVAVRMGERSLSVEPCDHLRVSAHLALARFPAMDWTGPVDAATFDRDLAPSRSFGRLKWAVPLKLYSFLTGKPVLRGANLRTTAGIVGSRVVGGMHVPDEPVRHRALDLVGDLALIGYPLLGHVRAAHTGHELNHALVSKLMAEPDAWELV